MTRVPKIASGKTSLADGIQCCPNNSIFLFYPNSLSVFWRIGAFTHMSGCVETVYELPLLLNIGASETFLHKSGAVRFVDGIYIVGIATWR
jgi:hypothetical protein